MDERFCTTSTQHICICKYANNSALGYGPICSARPHLGVRPPPEHVALLGAHGGQAAEDLGQLGVEAPALHKKFIAKCIGASTVNAICLLECSQLCVNT